MIKMLPRASEPQGPERAREMLREIASKRSQCAMLVFGEGDRAERIASSAQTCVGADPSRLVVRIPDVSVLAASADLAFLTTMINDGVDAAAMTLRFKVSSRLKGEQALRLHDLELAFARAQQGISS